MEINMKKYELSSFREKDFYKWEEIIDIIWGLECELEEKNGEIEHLKERINELENPEDNFGPDLYEDYKLGLLNNEKN